VDRGGPGEWKWSGGVLVRASRQLLLLLLRLRTVCVFVPEPDGGRVEWSNEDA
jgi:hypothetical protein